MEKSGKANFTPRIKTSGPGASPQAYSSPDKNFNYIPGLKASLSMKEGRDSYGLVVRTLKELGAKREEVKELPDDDTEKLRIRYKIEILVKMATFNSHGHVDLAAMKNEILFKTDNGDATAFREAVEEVLAKLGIEVKY